jgi:chromosome segregation ATPase
MAAEYDTTEFIDNDFQMNKAAKFSDIMTQPQRAPSREEVDSKVAEAQQKLAELKRAQEQLERERAALEETRRRQMEFQTGRQEMLQNLTRTVGILEESEFNARRDAEQMAKALADLREALERIQAVQEETWTKDAFDVELTRALTALENARMEWNSARLKFPVLSGEVPQAAVESKTRNTPTALFQSQSFIQLCKMGFAITWPLAVIGLGALALLAAVLFRR